MKKIFEIPIYAFDKKELDRRIEKLRESFLKEFGYIDQERVEQVWERHIYRQKNWDYNHIVGFIKI